MGHEIIKIGELEIYADEIAEITFNLYEDARIVRITFFSGIFCDFETNEKEKTNAIRLFISMGGGINAL